MDITGLDQDVIQALINDLEERAIEAERREEESNRLWEAKNLELLDYVLKMKLKKEVLN